MKERELALKLCKIAAKFVVDANGGVTMGGATFGEKYAEFLFRHGAQNVRKVAMYEDAIRHWVASVGYDSDGKFKIIISDSIQNC